MPDGGAELAALREEVQVCRQQIAALTAHVGELAAAVVRISGVAPLAATPVAAAAPAAAPAEAGGAAPAGTGATPLAAPPARARIVGASLELANTAPLWPEFYLREQHGVIAARITDSAGEPLRVRVLSSDGTPAPPAVVDGLRVTVHLERESSGVRAPRAGAAHRPS